MGLYDTYAGVQLKCGACGMRDFDVGDEVPLIDGVYAGYEGFVVVHNGKLLAKYPTLTTKHGVSLDGRSVFRNMSPFEKAVQDICNK